MNLDELRILIERHARPDMTTAIEGVMMSRHERSEPHPAMSGSVMALIAQGRKQIALGDRVYLYGAGQYLIASIDMPVTGQFIDATPERPALGCGLILQPAAIAELLLEAGGDGRQQMSGTPSGMVVSDASPDLVDAVVRLLRLLDKPRDAAMLAPLVKREILWRLINGEQGAAVRQLGLADSNLSHVARAVRWIRDNYSEAFRVDDIASLVGMSTSAFYRSFQAVTAMSPIQFQKQIRLQAARLMLAARPGDVAGVGFEVGYESPSQFSREYRRLFGAPPSEDAVRLRDTVSAVGAAI